MQLNVFYDALDLIETVGVSIFDSPYVETERIVSIDVIPVVDLDRDFVEHLDSLRILLEPGRLV